MRKTRGDYPRKEIVRGGSAMLRSDGGAREEKREEGRVERLAGEEWE